MRWLGVVLVLAGAARADELSDGDGGIDGVELDAGTDARVEHGGDLDGGARGHDGHGRDGLSGGGGSAHERAPRGLGCRSK